MVLLIIYLLNYYAGPAFPVCRGLPACFALGISGAAAEICPDFWKGFEMVLYYLQFSIWNFLLKLGKLFLY